MKRDSDKTAGSASSSKTHILGDLIGASDFALDIVAHYFSEHIPILQSDIWATCFFDRDFKANTILKWEDDLRRANKEIFWEQFQTQSETDSANSSRLKKDIDAITFLRKVDTKFGNQKEIFDMFLDIMLEFHSKRLQMDEVIDKVKDLFERHNGLICGFSDFLPKKKKIKLQDLNHVNYERAEEFILRVKDRFQNEEHIYQSFLEALYNYQKDSDKPDSKFQVIPEVCSLLEEHPDLIEGFLTILSSKD